MSPSILFVDDDRDLVTTSSRLIELIKRDTEPAFTGTEAIEKIRHGNYCLLILDIKLPDISGIEVVKRIREFNKKIKIVLITGHPEFKDAIDSLEYNIEEILLKPIAPSELLRVVNEYTGPISE
jgi:two-component system cell cycle response regulator